MQRRCTKQAKLRAQLWLGGGSMGCVTFVGRAIPLVDDGERHDGANCDRDL